MKLLRMLIASCPACVFLCMILVVVHFMVTSETPPTTARRTLACPAVYVRVRHFCMPPCPPTRALRNVAPTASASLDLCCPSTRCHTNRTQGHHCQHHRYHDNARIVTAFSTTPSALYFAIYRIHCSQTASLLPSNAPYLRSASAVFPVRPVASPAPPQRQRKPHSKSASDPKKTSTLLPFLFFAALKSVSLHLRQFHCLWPIVISCCYQSPFSAFQIYVTQTPKLNVCVIENVGFFAPQLLRFDNLRLKRHLLRLPMCS
jgi:hypothetical protein